jgi:hypothetical protein
MSGRASEMSYTELHGHQMVKFETQLSLRLLEHISAWYHVIFGSFFRKCELFFSLTTCNVLVRHLSNTANVLFSDALHSQGVRLLR